MNATLRNSIYHYCNYQERCHNEVAQKLYELGATKTEADALIVDLIQDNLLNEERFACAYARGKFRIKNWGKVKIIYHLKAKKISDYCIKKGLLEINQEEYETCLTQLIHLNWKALKTIKQVPLRKKKLFSALMRKGFESEIINRLLEDSQL